MAENNNFDIRDSINGDAIIGFTSAKDIKNIGFADAATVGSWFQDGENSTAKHLGMIDLFSATHNVRLPFMTDLFKGSQVMECEDGQSITYDLPVKRSIRCVTAVDTSGDREKPGIDGGVFTIILDTEHTKGDVLSYDPMYGAQVIVDDNYDVERQGENYVHYVRLVTNDKRDYFPKDKLKAGIEYVKVGHNLAEFGTDYSKINLMNAPAGSITNEFILGNNRGVETFYTKKANGMSAPKLAEIGMTEMEDIKNKMDMFGGKSKEMFFIANKTKSGKIDKSSVKVGATLEYLALMELAKIECHQLYFQKAATIPTANGVMRLNEGAWHQIRRGKLIQYSKPGGITKQQIMEAVAYMFKGRTDIPPHMRKVKFKAGWYAYLNMMEIFREEISQQYAGLAPFLGTDRGLPTSPLQGNLDALTMKPVIFKAVSMPGIGTVEVEHDPSLDYQPYADRFSSGYFGDGLAHTAYSLVIFDATDSQYSNADVSSKVKGGTVIKGGNNKANVYYVKPEGAHVTYGYEQGRMANGSRVSDIQSSLPQMGRTFWANSQSAALILDTTRYIVIELKPRG